MTRVVVRLLVSLVCVPMLVVVCAMFGFVTSEANLLSEGVAVLVAMSAGPILCVAAWALVWRRVIRWTRRRWVSTLVVVFGAIVLELTVGIASFMWGSWRIRDWEPLVAMTNLLIGAAAAIACLWIWTETPRERLERLKKVGVGVRVCPACRYDMSGLSNLMCPECGTAYTLGELAEAHQRREAPADFE